MDVHFVLLLVTRPSSGPFVVAQRCLMARALRWVNRPHLHRGSVERGRPEPGRLPPQVVLRGLRILHLHPLRAPFDMRSHRLGASIFRTPRTLVRHRITAWRSDGRAASGTPHGRDHSRVSGFARHHRQRDTRPVKTSVGASALPRAKKWRWQRSHTRYPGTYPASAHRIVPPQSRGHGTSVTAGQ